MFEKPKATSVVAMEIDAFVLRGLVLSLLRGKLRIETTFNFLISDFDAGSIKSITEEQRSQLDDLVHQHLLVTSLNMSHLLVRPLELSLVKDKDIRAVLSSQVEMLLPYPIENAVVDRLLLSQDKEGSRLTILAARKDHVVSHLADWNALGIEPEVVSADPQALALFAHHFYPNMEMHYVLHLRISHSLCILVDKGKLIAAQSISHGVFGLISAYSRLAGMDLIDAYKQLATFDLNLKDEALQSELEILRQQVTRTLYALTKQTKGKSADGVLMTGIGSEIKGIREALCLPLNKEIIPVFPGAPIITDNPRIAAIIEKVKTVFVESGAYEKLCSFLASSKIKAKVSSLYSRLIELLPIKAVEPGIELSARELEIFALPIGAALSALPLKCDQVNFRQGEFAYPAPWKRLKKVLTGYFLLCVGLAAALTFYGIAYVSYREVEIRQRYLELLDVMNKPYNDFESEFTSKYPSSYSGNLQNGLIPLENLSNEQIQSRLMYLEKEVQSTPQIYPLQPNIPLVSDVLAWIGTHQAFIGADEESPSLEIENFQYSLVKKPDPTKKQEKYQVKIDLEFYSPTPKMARAFHDALITPNEIVDDKGEIKWSSNRDSYRTSFYLKDRTSYTAHSP